MYKRQEVLGAGLGRKADGEGGTVPDEGPGVGSERGRHQALDGVVPGAAENGTMEGMIGADEEGGGRGMTGWIIFFLIFVVGNGILYATTGIFFIPIPRK
mgnify:CR=1 FL=1